MANQDTAAMAAIPAPYSDYLTVKPDWLDLNGHMNVAYYLHAFDDGGEVFFGDCGIGWEYTKDGRGSLFISQSNLEFRQELLDGDKLKVTTLLVDWSPKLVHTYQALYHADKGYLAATAEMLMVHISFVNRRSAPMPERAQNRLAEIAEVHGKLSRPENLGRAIGIKR